MLLFSFWSSSSTAQSFNYVAASRSVINNNMMQFQMRQMMMFNLNSMRWNYKDNMFTNNKLTFDLVLNNAETKQFKSKIYIDTIQRKTYLVAVDKSFNKDDPKREQKIYPADIKSISIARGDYEGTFEPKLTTDSCWMFRVIDGDIKVYSNALAIVAIQKNDGPMQPFSLTNLQVMVQDDPKAVKFFEKKNYLKAITKYNSNHEKLEASTNHGG
jgi:hypothetical protein